ncbi:MAG: alpha-galactosidase [Oscillospiraceae bacterium]|nr:alpha-galactosidase [Oscillospiraceae bacterium]
MAITYFENEKTFLLQTEKTAYAFCVSNEGYLCHLHWGGMVNSPADLPTLDQLSQRVTMIGRRSGITELLEYRSWGGSSAKEPALKITFPDGTRNLFLVYKSHEISGDTLSVTLREVQYGVEVTLYYRVCEKFDIIERWSVIKNTSNENFNIEMAAGANWRLPDKEQYRLTYFSGNYGHEFQMNREKLGAAKRVLETRRGLSGYDCAPFFMVDDGSASEHHGAVYFGSVLWSGNWKITVELDSRGNTEITGGINDFDFNWLLEPGATYETAKFIAGYLTEGGFGGVGRRMHRYERAEIIHPMERDRVLPIIYNTHNTFWNRVDERIVLDEIDAAHEAGIELFILEGGWTGYHDLDSTVNNSQAHRLGYGTWEVNELRFPNGLKPIADRIHGYGMKFGLWIEPEAVFPTNKIAVEHPEWIVGYEHRESERIGAMGTLTLDMANDDACDYIIDVFTKLIGENEIDYVKNDFNREIPHMGYRSGDLARKKEGWDRYVRNMWRCYRTLKERFPNLIFENSAAGGKRTDLAMLGIAGRMHRSDNQDPLDAVTMFDTMSYFIPPKFQGGACFVSAAFSQWFNERPASIEYQGHMAMLSSMSVSMPLQTSPEEDMEELRRVIQLDKQVREVTQLGDMYRIASVLEKDYGIYQYVNYEQTKSVVFVMGQTMQFAQMPDRACLMGLKPDASYKVTGHGKFYKKPFCRYEVGQPGYYQEIPERTKDYGVFSGNGLMSVGLPIWVKGNARSEVIVIEEV